MYPRILVPLDGSPAAERVLPYVRLLGKSTQVQVALLRVVSALPTVSLADPAYEAHKQQIASSLDHEARGYLIQTEGSLKDCARTSSLPVRHGQPVSAILEEAERVPGTLIAMATHGRSGISRWVWGSVTDKVLHTASNPLLIVRSRGEETPASDVSLERIIVPLDGSSLAEQVMPHVVDLARDLNLGVYLVQVTPSAGEYYRHMATHPLGGTVANFYPPYEEFSKHEDAEAERYLAKIQEHFTSQGVSSVEKKIVHGAPAETIVNIALESPSSLVAMTTHGRSGLGRWAFGSVADRVARHSGGPVLLIRADHEAAEANA